MAYVSTEMTKRVRQQLKAEFPEIKFRVNRGTGGYHGAMYVTIDSAPYNFLPDGTTYLDISYHNLDKGYRTRNAPHSYDPEFDRTVHMTQFERADILKRIFEIANEGNWDRSDIMTDYFDVGFYLHFSIGSWDRPFVCTTNNTVTNVETVNGDK